MLEGVRNFLGNKASPAIQRPETTSLSPDEEIKYRNWVDKNKIEVNDNYDGHDYDYRGYWKENGDNTIKNGEHFTDRYKLPNHPSFSNESKYFNSNTKKAGYQDVIKSEYQWKVNKRDGKAGADMKGIMAFIKKGNGNPANTATRQAQKSDKLNKYIAPDGTVTWEKDVMPDENELINPKGPANENGWAMSDAK